MLWRPKTLSIDINAKIKKNKKNKNGEIEVVWNNTQTCGGSASVTFTVLRGSWLGSGWLTTEIQI